MDGWDGMYDEFMTRRDAPTMIMNDLHRCDWCTPCRPSPFTDLLLLLLCMYRSSTISMVVVTPRVLPVF